MATRKKLPARQFLRHYGACEEACAWVGKRTPYQAWHECPRGDWLLYMAGCMGVDWTLLTKTACAAARTVLHCFPEAKRELLLAIEAAEGLYGIRQGTKKWDRHIARVERLATTALNIFEMYEPRPSYREMDMAYFAGRAAADAAFAARDHGVDAYHAVDDACNAAFAYRVSEVALTHPFRTSVKKERERAARLVYREYARLVRRYIRWSVMRDRVDAYVSNRSIGMKP